MMPKPARVFAVALCLLFSFSALGAQDETGAPSVGMGPRLGLFWQGQSADTSIQGVETSGLVQSIGVEFFLPISPVVAFEPGLDFFYDEYIYLEELGRAVMTSRESASSWGPLATVLGVHIGLPFSFRADLSEHFALVFRSGLGGFFRFPVAGIDGTDAEDLPTIAADLNGAGRWLYPEFGIGFNGKISERTRAEFGVQALLPLHRAWDRTELPFWDSLVVWASLGLKLSF